MSNPSQVPLIWQQAITRYEEITKKKLDDPALKDVTTVDGLLRAIDNENNVFSDFREKRHGIFTALTIAMRPVEVVGDLAAGGVSMAFPPSSLVFGAVQFLMSAAKGVSTKYDAIMGLMSTLKDFTIRLETYARQQISQNLSDKLADILTTLIEVFALSRQEIKHGRLLSFGKNVLLGNDEGKAAMAKLANLIDSERGLVGAETLMEVRGYKTFLSRVDYNVMELTKQVGDMALAQEQVIMQAEKQKDKGHQDRVKKVLQPGTSADDKYRTINRTRVPNTGDWIRYETDFKDWMNKKKSILWVSGNPGAGKSFIASNIINYLKETYPQNVQHPSHMSVAYFFFKDDNPRTRSFHQALCDIAFKIAQNDPAYEKHVTSCVDSPEDIETLQSVWQRLFLDFFIENENSDSSACIVLDALDEALVEDRLEFFEVAKDIQQGGRLQLLMLGRPHIGEEMDDLMSMLSISTIYVSSLNNSDDIIHYIESSIAKSAYLKRASKTLQAEIVEKLSAGAQGMFIWVDLMLKELLKKKDEGSMRKTLKEAPTGLSKMIRHVLKGFSESLKDNTQYADDLNEMLAWTTCALRPLKLEEMENMLKWRYPQGEGRIWLEGDLRRQYASFFLLTREDRLTTADLQHSASFGGILDTEEQSNEYGGGFDDPDNPSDFNSDPRTTEVTFNHASLGEFFRNEKEGKLSAGDDCPSIGVDYQEARILVLKRYFEVICCESNSPKISIALALRPYALQSVVAGLKVIDIEQTSTADKQVIGVFLAQLLSKQSVVVTFSGGVNSGFYCQENLNVIDKWLGDKDVQESLPPLEKTWYDEAVSENKADIFLRFIKHSANQWLQDVWWNSQILCNIIFNFLNLRRGSPSLPLNSADEVLETAEWCGLEKNALWHRRLAMALRDHGYHDQALEYFQKALELDPGLWLARDGMSKTYVAKKEYRKAIELDKITIGELEKQDQTDSIKGSLHITYERSGDCYDELEDDENGLAMYQKGFEKKNRCDDCICAIMCYFHEQGRYDETIAMLQSMDEKIADKEYTRLTESLLTNVWISEDFFTWFSIAAFHTKNTPFILQAYTAAVATAHKERKAVQAANLELCLGSLYEVYGHDSERAARIWERLINTYRGTKAEEEIRTVLEIASDKLANHCLRQCMEFGASMEETQKYGRTLELLASGKPLNFHDIKGDKENHFITDSPIGLYLGNYYKVCGREEEAMECYRAQVKECIRLLSDDDPSNDVEAYYRLASVLSAVRDDENAIGLFYYYKESMRFMNKDKEDGKDESGSGQGDNSNDDDKTDLESKKSEKETKEAEDNDSNLSDNDDGDSYVCDGCTKSFPRLDGISICRYCSDIGFCGTCIQQLKAGTLPMNVCGKKHDWILVPERSPAELTRAKEQANMLFIQGDWISPEEFKNRLREKWTIKDKF